MNTHKPPPCAPTSSWSCRQAGCSTPHQLERAQSLGDVATIRAAHLGAGQLFSRLAAGKAKCELTPEEPGYKGQRSAVLPGAPSCCSVADRGALQGSRPSFSSELETPPLSFAGHLLPPPSFQASVKVYTFKGSDHWAYRVTKGRSRNFLNLCFHISKKGDTNTYSTYSPRRMAGSL